MSAEEDYTVFPALLSDVPACAEIFHDAFTTHPVLAHLHPQTPPSALRDHDIALFHTLISQPPQYGGRFYKLVHNDTGEMVAFARWLAPLPDADEELVQERWRREEDRGVPDPEGMNEGLVRDWFVTLRDGRRKWVDVRKTWFLHLLCVKPGYQRKGLGKMMLEHGLKEVDGEGGGEGKAGRCYVEASPVGEGLYERFGWTECDELLLRMGKYGVEGEGNAEGGGVVRLKCMMREAQGRVDRKMGG